ncbi:MAG: hypothetical protein OEM43_05400 [Gammaproteobacteria bacterium]|nr:hypothetical protein [Gammaproteobacteria bacterium]
MRISRYTLSYLLILLLPLTSIMADTPTETGPIPDPRIQEAIALMNGFAEHTGLSSGQPRRRYLWTDAFAVCNYLGLAHTTGEEHYTGLALQLVDQVHHTLGRHRDDDRRTGWISGLDAADGERHPTRGGLRIGKALPERGPDEPLDERLEWDRDGQYFHYLTKWMHALDQVTRTTQQSRFNAWARELARSAFDAFSYPPAPERGPRRMAWKMSIDLTRVLVPSMGQHDPLDGYITSLQLRTTAAAQAEPAAGPDLEDTTGDYAAMIRRSEWATADPLGLGGLLIDAWRVQQLIQQGTQPDVPLLDRLLEGAITGLQHYDRDDELHQPARYRLAFRELGLAIGLHALERLQRVVEQGTPRTPASPRLRAQLQELMQYLPLRDEIETFWRDPANQRTDTWTEHRDINAVMLATSLAPDGFLMLLPPKNKATGD